MRSHNIAQEVEPFKVANGLTRFILSYNVAKPTIIAKYASIDDHVSFTPLNTAFRLRY